MGKRGAGLREPNGRLSRRVMEELRRRSQALETEERDTLAPALEARIRVHGVSVDKMRDPKLGSAVGRYCLQGELTSMQYEAAMLYLADCRAYSIAMLSPRQPGAIDLNATHGGSVEVENVIWTERCMKRMQEARAAIQAKQNEVRLQANLWAAIDLILVRDHAMHHLVGDLRYALNALARHYGLEGGDGK